MFTGNTDPTPYILAAYVIGTVGIFGLAGYFIIQRKQLRQLLAVIDNGENKDG